MGAAGCRNLHKLSTVGWTNSLISPPSPFSLPLPSTTTRHVQAECCGNTEAVSRLPSSGRSARHRAMGRHCFTTTVKPGKLEEYIKMHDNIYPEVAAGLRACGVTQLTIFLQPGNPARLIMYIETAGDIDLALATGPGSRYRLEPRCREWEGQTRRARGREIGSVGASFSTYALPAQSSWTRTFTTGGRRYVRGVGVLSLPRAT